MENRMNNIINYLTFIIDGSEIKLSDMSRITNWYIKKYPDDSIYDLYFLMNIIRALNVFLKRSDTNVITFNWISFLEKENMYVDSSKVRQHLYDKHNIDSTVSDVNATILEYYALLSTIDKLSIRQLETK